ncbi:uncharacterized protein LOC132316214 [Cornus florida]|uniref:uncharacterized protein LOC132316214 n=1 Tax=Cornus florida TaxID=4283 RepID=UPI00289EF7FF|nr:uncharacterized protein LOC132316214 [Cornus florida]
MGKIMIFDGENYDFWYVKIKTIFLSYDLWDYVEDEYDESEDTTTLTNAERQQLKDHKKKDAKALGLIQQGVADTIFPRIINASKAKEAWDILEKGYRGSTKTYGEDISNQRIVEKILISLPEKYDSIVAVIEETKELENLSVEELMGSIKAFEQRLSKRSEKTIESAFQSKLNVSSRNQEKYPSSFDRSKGESSRGGRHGRGRGRGRNSRGRGRNNFERSGNIKSTQQNCGICKRSSHVDKDCWFWGKPQCFNCKKFGHVQKDYRLKINQQANFSEEQEGETSMFYACHSTSEQNDDVWFLDSGCSNYMTGDKNIFLEIDFSSNSQVRMGNGALVQAKGKCTIAIETKKGRKHIRDVLLVPDLEQNLLSVGQLVEHGYSIHFDEDSCKIYDKESYFP